jgi:hypothetical protein
MNQYRNQPPNLKTIEMLKVARDQVMQADIAGEVTLPATGVQETPPKQAQYTTPNKFVKEFVEKLTSLDQEKAAVEEEMAKVEKLLSNLVEKKRQLENRRIGLIKVKDKLRELDKEMSDALKSV